MTEESAVTYAYQITRNGELVVTTVEKSSQEDTDDTETSQTYNPFGDVVLDVEGYLYEYNTNGTDHKIDGQMTD